MPQKTPQKTDLFLSLEDTVEVIDQDSELVWNGKAYVVESANYNHKVVSMKHPNYKGIDWIEVND